MSLIYRTSPPRLAIPSGTRLVNVSSYNGWVCCSRGNTTSAKTSRVKHDIRLDGRNVRLVFSPIYTDNATGSELALGNAVEMTATIEDTSGNIYPVTFNGSRVAIVAGSEVLVSDPVGIFVEAGGVLYTRTFVHRLISNTYNKFGEVGRIAANQSNLPSNHFITTSRSGCGMVVTASTGINPFSVDSTDSGSIADTQSDQVWCPCAIIAETRDDRVASCGFIGDSITKSTPGWRTRYPNMGWVGEVGAICPTINAGRSGDKLSYFSGLHARIRSKLMSFCDAVWVGLGNNDVAAGQSLAQMQSDWLAAVRSVRAFCPQVMGMTLFPRTTSVDGWETSGGQTPMAYDSTRSEFNSWLFTSGSEIKGVFNGTSLVEEPTGGVWNQSSVLASGTASAVGALTLTDGAASYTTNAFDKNAIYNVTANLCRQIGNNTNTTFTNTASWSITIGDAYKVLTGWTVDGTHPALWAQLQIGAGFNSQYIDPA